MASICQGRRTYGTRVIGDTRENIFDMAEIQALNQNIRALILNKVSNKIKLKFQDI